MLSEALTVGFNKLGSDAGFLLTHVFKQFGGSGIRFATAVGEIGEDTDIFFLPTDIFTKARIARSERSWNLRAMSTPCEAGPRSQVLVSGRSKLRDRLS